MTFRRTARGLRSGGSSRMEGACELAEEVFHMPVRIGVPEGVAGLLDVVRNPIYSTGVGLLLFGQLNRPRSGEGIGDGSARSIWSRMKSWFQGRL